MVRTDPTFATGSPPPVAVPYPHPGQTAGPRPERNRMESRDHLARPGQTVRQTVRLDVVDPEADGLSLEADLGYDPTDPYAMTIVFHTGTGPVAWSFGRELLVHGSYGPT